LKMLSNPEERSRLDLSASLDPTLKHISDWGGRQIVQSFSPSTKRYEGRMVRDIAVEEGKSAFDALLDIVCADELRTTFRVPQQDSRADWVARVEALRDPRIAVGGSDAGAHLDILGTFNYTTYLLEHAVRRQGLMTTEEVVHLLTQAPAQLYGLHDRGVLAPGMRADMVIFDEEQVGTEELWSNFDLPSGAGRLYADSVGVHQVLVSGEPIIEDGLPTGARPGSVLRAGRDTVTPSLTT
jgi:N-acyl-D-aspartate/D-glutamate deacylase